MMTQGKRLYVLDTNVLMHDPTALFKFEEHDVFLPMQVIEELDNGKKGTSEASRNARQVSRFINELIEEQGTDKIATGLVLNRPNALQLRGAASIGKLRFQTTVPTEDKTSFGAVAPDNRILGAILQLRRDEPDFPVVFVSKDINLRIKAAIAGIVSEDYENDRALDDFSLLYTGANALPEDFWQRYGKDLKSWTDKGRTFYEVAIGTDDDWYPNQYLYLPGDDEAEFRVARVDGGKAVLQIVDDYRGSQHAVWGITARNREQNFALNALMDPEIDFVTLLGTAGTGKTLLALAAGLAQTMDQQRYREIIMTRATVSVGEDIGFLPGHGRGKDDAVDGRAHRQSGGAHAQPGRRQLGTGGDQRPAGEPDQDPLAQLHARAHLPQPLADPGRGAEPHPQADEDPDHPRRSRHQDRVPGQRGADRHALPHRDHVGPDLRRRPVQELGAQRARDPAPRRALAPGGLRVRGVVTPTRSPDKRSASGTPRHHPMASASIGVVVPPPDALRLSGLRERQSRGALTTRPRAPCTMRP
jgi:predicted ribonuclease YlaK